MSAQSYQSSASRNGSANAYKAQAQRQAAYLFDKARGRNWLAEASSVWNKTPRSLLNLKTVQASVNEVELVDLGEQVVPISQIKGSANAGRTADFDINFRPLKTHTKDRWLSVAAALHQGAKLPPVLLIQPGDIYYVEDGHHRISVAKAMGEKEIVAKVTALQVKGSSTVRLATAGNA